MKTTMSKMKNTLDKINGRLDIAEEKIRESEGIVIEITTIKCRKKRTSVSSRTTLSGVIYV